MRIQLFSSRFSVFVVVGLILSTVSVLVLTTGAPASAQQTITGVQQTVSGVTVTPDQIRQRNAAQQATPVSPRGIPFYPIPLPSGSGSAQNSVTPNNMSAILPKWPQAAGTLIRGPTTPDSGWFPPDTMGAVGPTQYLFTVNGRFRAYNKTSPASPVFDTTDSAFWAVIGVFDPHVRYDPTTHTWFITELDGGTNGGDNHILLAESSGADLSIATWRQFRINGTGSGSTQDQGCFLDYDTPGIDQDAIYIGINVYTNNNTNIASCYNNSKPEIFLHANIYVVQKSSLSGTANITSFYYNGGCFSCSTLQGVDSYYDDLSTGYMIGVSSTSSLSVYQINNTGSSTPTLSGPFSIAVQQFHAPIGVFTPNNASRAMAGDDARLLSAVIRNGHLWTSHNIAVDATGVSTGTVDRDAVRWYDVNIPSLTVHQWGNVYDSSTNKLSYWFGTAMVSGQGHVAIGMNQAGASSSIRGGSVGRLATDGSNQMEGFSSFITGTNDNYNDNTDGSVNRWGDYTYTSLDPCDDMTMWTVQEYVVGATDWGIAATQLKAPPPAVLPGGPIMTIQTGLVSTPLALTGTSPNGEGFYDTPSNTDATCRTRLTAVVTNGVTVSSVTYTDSKHITLTLNTTAATAGTATVTITNPDGQTVSTTITLFNSVVQTGSVSGRVLNSAMNPVPGATVSVSASGVSTATTDSGGYYVLNKIPAGLVTVTASHPQYGIGSQSVTVIANASVSAPDIVLTSSGNCPGPTLNSPPPDYISSSQTITFTWSAPSECTFSGYTFRIKDVPNMDSGDTPIVDWGDGNTSWTQTIDPKFDNIDLYWGVRTANPLSPNWSVQHFRIQPGGGGGQVQLCTSADGSSGCVTYGTGIYDLSGTSLNDQFQYVKVSSGWSIWMFQDGHLQSQSDCTTINRQLPSGAPWDLRGQLTSFQVADHNICHTSEVQSVVLAWNGDGTGPFMGMGNQEGLFNVPSAFNDAANSVYIPNNWSAKLYIDANGGGGSQCLTGEVTNLGSIGLGSNISSVEIFFTSNCQHPSPPTAPTLQVTDNTQTSITISWNGVSNAGGFNIYRLDWGSGQFIKFDSVGSNTTSYTDTTLTCSGSAYYEVTAYNSYGESPLSNYVGYPTKPCLVTNTNDSGPGSLRYVIASATTGVSITFDPTVFNTPQTITLTSGPLMITQNVTIQGPGANLVAVDGNFTSTVFTINSSVTAGISGLTVQHGNASSGNGGGISNTGSLTVNNSTFSGNSGGYGGAIYNNGTLTISKSAFFGNSATYGGAFLNDFNGTTTVSNSTLSGNSASSYGGAIYVGGGTLTVGNSTVSNNAAVQSGGGIYLWVVGTLNLGSTIVSGNTHSVSVPDDINGPITSLGNNLIGNTSGTSGFVSSDQQNVDPKLNLLALNAPGTTQTMSLQAGSPAVGKGNCNLNSPASPVTTDQRGVARRTPCDVGAYESSLTSSIGRLDTIGIFRPSVSNGTFYMRLHNSTGFADTTVTFNPAGKAYPVIGDWTGNGYDTVGVFDQNNGLFTLCTVNDTTSCGNSANWLQFVLGNPNDQPLSGHWSVADTHDGGGVFRPSNGLIYLKDALTTGFADYTMVLGIPGDVGLAGDWNGDGLDSLGVYRPSNSTFYLNDQTCNCSLFGTYQFAYGIGGDAPMVGDWIGQGHDGIGLFRQSNGYTYLRNALTTGYADNTFVYGIAGDIPVAGHWQLVYPPKPNPGSVLVPPTFAPIATPKPQPTGGLGD